ncbi:hypothetical protein Fcan01_27504 [Folsomia candida]|uniref:Uncharacterized protein n=1 Tax=Folsomia candida TaxID=158441 RepID=A0A226CXP6_FOLCA|nr:hypothetical protein Fcan01_27504 [Folsomia candida]
MDLDDFNSRFKKLVSSHVGKVRELQVPFHLGKGIDGYHLIKGVQDLGKQLTSLRLEMFKLYRCSDKHNGVGSVVQFLDEFSLQGLILPSITKLEIDAELMLSSDKMYFRRIMSKLAPLFPNVSALTLSCPGREELTSLCIIGPPFHRLRSFSIIGEDSCYLGNTPLTLHPWWQLIAKFEFDARWSHNGYGVHILKTLAPTLVYLHVVKPKSPFIPVMGRLRIMKVTLPSWKMYEGKGRFLFETADRVKGIKIEYEKQFRILEKIRGGVFGGV